MVSRELNQFGIELRAIDVRRSPAVESTGSSLSAASAKRESMSASAA